MSAPRYCIILCKSTSEKNTTRKEETISWQALLCQVQPQLPAPCRSYIQVPSCIQSRLQALHWLSIYLYCCFIYSALPASRAGPRRWREGDLRESPTPSPCFGTAHPAQHLKLCQPSWPSSTFQVRSTTVNPAMLCTPKIKKIKRGKKKTVSETYLMFCWEY